MDKTRKPGTRPSDPRRQRHAAPDQDHRSRPQRDYASRSPPSNAKYFVDSNLSAQSAQPSASPQTGRSPTYAARLLAALDYP